MFLLLFLTLLLQNGKPEIRIPDLERLLHQSINLERRFDQRTQLEWDDTLSTLARAHSEDMAKRSYFQHIDPEGLTPMKRLQAAGYNKCQLVGENIHQNNLYSKVTTQKKKTTYDWNSMETIANTTLKAWMDSPGHRETILEKNYGREGIGIAIASDDKVYVTQILCGETS